MFLSFASWSSAQQIHRNGFESPKLSWKQGGFDAPFEERKHEISDKSFQNGRSSEYLMLEVRPGNFVHYLYPIGKAPVNEDFAASLWIKANRPNIQIMGRLVLPRENDPNNLDSRITTFLRGETYTRTGQWQRLELARPMTLVKQQQQLLQSQFKRPLDFGDAYVDALVLNLYAGPGATEVWIDDLEAGPVFSDTATPTTPRPIGATPANVAGPANPNNQSPPIEFNGAQFKLGQKGVIFRAIMLTDTPISVWKNAGFNAIVFRDNVQPTVLKEANEQGMFVIPHLRIRGDDGQPVTQDAFASQLNRFQDSDKLFYILDNTLTGEHAGTIGQFVSRVRTADPGRPSSVDVWDGYGAFSRQVSMLGAHRWPLMTTMELVRQRDWYDQRRKLAAPGSFFWTWIQTHLPDELVQLLYERGGGATFNEPVGPLPEQIKLLSYCALTSGYRGLAFWSDRFMADSHQGRDRLLMCALLNQEIEILEPLLSQAEDPVEWIPTSSPDVQAAVMRVGKAGVLVLPVWLGKFSQMVPGQAALAKISMVVPQVSASTQAWEVTPADVRGLKTTRKVGGTEVTLPEFGLTSAILFTANTELIGKFQEQARNRKQLAADWSKQMATYEIEKVSKIQELLAQQGRAIPDSSTLLNDAAERLKLANTQYENRNFAEAYREAQRALRPVRVVMRTQWEQAVRGADTPALSPYTASYFTLPRHFQFMDQRHRSRVGDNLLVGGDFEAEPRESGHWQTLISNPDNYELVCRRVPAVYRQASPDETANPASVEPAKEGKQCMVAQIKPRAGQPVPAALERTVLRINSPTVKLPPGTQVQISGWLHVPVGVTASTDGAMMFDTAAGDALAVRLTDATGKWKKFTFYRRVPANGEIGLVVVLTGIGSVYFDDMRIEPLIPTSGMPTLSRGAP